MLGYLCLLLQLLCQLLNDAVLISVQQGEVLDVHVSLLQLAVKIRDLPFLLVHNQKFRIDVLRGDVRDLTGSARIVKRAQVLFEVLV